MKFSNILLVLMGTVANIVMAAPQVPICTFDPVKGEYVCPTPATPQVPTCTFDLVKGEYVCPTVTATSCNELDTTITNVASAKCGQEGLRKCTSLIHGSVCKNGKWELVRRCPIGQICAMTEGNLCCRYPGLGPC